MTNKLNLWCWFKQKRVMRLQLNIYVFITNYVAFCVRVYRQKIWSQSYDMINLTA